MKPISDVYPDAGEYGYFGVYDYGPLIESIGHEVLVKVDDDDYQGDSNVLFRRADGAFGYLNFGWGSCSGCDALQACDSYEDLESLRNSLVAGIHWFGSLDAVMAYLGAPEREGEYRWHVDEWRKFVAEVAALGASSVPGTPGEGEATDKNPSDKGI